MAWKRAPLISRMAAALLPMLLMLSTADAAQAQADDPEVEIEEVVVVGTRALPRSVEDSPVPVDTIASEDFERQGGSDMSNLIRTLVPSFHVSDNPSRDLAALLRPVQLRGLAPDHTLVLMNNKRRHRGSVIQWISNGASNGSQGPDISAIPAIAIKRMEVLRDGAAAQYGSDAIAGVLNFVLKDASEGVAVEAKHGFYTADSAEDLTTVATNIGLPLSGTGFANLSFEYSQSAPTDRSVQHGDATALIGLGIPNVAVPAKPWGSPDVSGVKAVGNFGIDLDESRSLYAFGNFARRRVETPFFYRSPMNRNGVYKTSANIYLVGGEGCQAKYDVPSTAENLLAFREAIRADDACFSFVEPYPEGFTPIFGAVMTDYSAVAGIKGVLANGLLYDVSGSVGQNNMDGFLNNTMNPSFGPDAQLRDFEVGEYTQSETNFNVDLAYPVDVGLASDLNVAGGIEWREEEFEITTGEQASWEIGPYQQYGFGTGSNGFGGFNPTASGTWDRSNIATYLDLEVEPTENWLIGGAVRWEEFDSFGSTTNVKLATGVWLTDAFALRGSVGTGFRAPTPGQSNARNVATVVNAQTNEFEERGTIGSTHPVAMALGGRELKPEESENLSLGAVLALGNGLSLTVDYFRIDVDDRIALSRTFDVSEETKAELVAAGIPEARNFTSVRYFTNDFDTRTQGVDVVLTYGWETDLGSTDLQLSFNHTETEVLGYREGSTIADEDDIDNLERGVPEMRVNLTLTHSMDQWDFLGRYSYYGDWYDDHSAADFDGYGLLDAQATYNFLSGLALTVGAENVLDEYPDLTINYGNGRKYPRYAPGGYNGALVYAKLSYAM
ncbi:MAG: TonB-dependent receptor [Rhodospirillales bacterium]|nr:TonB-dependent receptor [Rhodospirillales bacterium]